MRARVRYTAKLSSARGDIIAAGLGNRVKVKQVCVQPRSSALDTTLPAFAAERRRRVVSCRSIAAAGACACTKNT